MSIADTLRAAARSVLRNKMRSFLTALGVIIGVAAVIAMVAIGEGAKARVEAAFAAMGTNVLVVSSGSTRAGGAKGGSGTMPTLTWEDMKAIRSEVPGVRNVAPRVRAVAQIVADQRNWSTWVDGTSGEFFAIRNWPARLGTTLSQADVDGGAKVAVLGQTVAQNLFGAGVNPVGRTVRIHGAPFEVIGVASGKGQSPGGNDYDDVVFVPVSTFLARIQGGLQKYVPGTILVGVESDEQTVAAAERVTSLLRDRHHIRAGEEDDFSIRNQAETADRKAESTRTLTLLLASIAAVSLMVGGIGIMNIMLVSVTERTREIGIRMAVGARRRDILSQFLAEALALSIAGGTVGVAVGVLAAHLMASRFEWPMLVRPDTAMLAVGFSAVVGVVFGLYPARKAARLDPIDALRYE